MIHEKWPWQLLLDDYTVSYKPSARHGICRGKELRIVGEPRDAKIAVHQNLVLAYYQFFSWTVLTLVYINI